MTSLEMLRNPTIQLGEELSFARVQVRVPSLALGTSASGLRRKDSSESLTLVSIKIYGQYVKLYIFFPRYSELRTSSKMNI